MKKLMILLPLTWMAASLGCNTSSGAASSPLAEAVAHEDWMEASRILDENGDPNSTLFGVPIIALALELGKFDFASKLADKGADLEARVEGDRLIDYFEKAAGKNPSESAARKAVEWLESRGVKRSP